MNGNIKYIIKIIIYPLVLLRRKYIITKNKRLGEKNPEKLAKIIYIKKFKKSLNLKNPENLNEKIKWLELYTDTSEWSTLADKYRVRKYIKECGLEQMLVKLYGVWENVNDIDFNVLPNSFVLKTNNASGTNIIVRDKSRLKIKKTKKQLNKWLKIKDFGIDYAVLHYAKIKPCIIAEEYLEEKSTEYSTSLIDYKFWCFNGEPYSVMACYDREGGAAHKIIYDLSWNRHTEFSAPGYEDYKLLPKPKSFDQMINASKILAKRFPQVRIDFYDIDGKPYFGEMTFSSDAGYVYYLTQEYLLKLGLKINLDKITR